MLEFRKPRPASVGPAGVVPDGLGPASAPTLGAAAAVGAAGESGLIAGGFELSIAVPAAGPAAAAGRSSGGQPP
jgi:hypothetical protein